MFLDVTPRSVWLCATGAVLMGLALLAHASVAAPWSPGDVWITLIGGDTPFAPLIQEIRLPRTAAACLAGAMLALSGVLFQALTGNREPLDVLWENVVTMNLPLRFSMAN